MATTRAMLWHEPLLIFHRAEQQTAPDSAIHDSKRTPVHGFVQVDYGDLLQAIQESCREMGLQAVGSFVAKCIQLYETTLVRHGLMLVGPTMGGKTVCYRVLQKVCWRSWTWPA